MKRVTLQRPIEVKGLGLHKGKETKVLMLPSEEESGIMIGTSKEGRRYPIGECELFSPGRASCILLPDGQMIYTMEHLLSAFYGMGVDDAVILVVGGEIPIFDGSAEPWVRSIIEAGLREKEDTKRTVCTLLSPLYLEDDFGEAWIACFPSETLKVSYIISFDDAFIGTQIFASFVTRETFCKDIAPARTFVRLKDVEELRKEGLALGGNLNNALVFNDKGLLNSTQLRFRDECARHKALDLLGDLSMAGLPLQAHVVGYKAGHRLHLRMVHRLRRLCRGG